MSTTGKDLLSILGFSHRTIGHKSFPKLRWLALLWLLVYLPTYANAYGYWHFLFLCNLGICLTSAGLIFNKPLLLSSQSLAAPSIAMLWIVDACARLLTGQHLHGGTAYMWDASLPVLVRVLSLYHLAWPLLLAYCLSMTGYDRRAFALQAVIATCVFAIGLYIAPAAENLNYVRQSPGAALAHANPTTKAAMSLALLVFLIYWPTHRLLIRLFAAKRPDSV